MFSQVALQLHRHAAWLMAGQHDRIVAEYSFPLPVHLGTSRLIVRTPEEAKAMLRLQREVYAKRGITAPSPNVSAMDLPRNGRFRIWVDWHEAAQPERDRQLSSVTYYCRRTLSGFRIEMVDYTRTSMPELQPQFAALALSA